VIIRAARAALPHLGARARREALQRAAVLVHDPIREQLISAAGAARPWRHQELLRREAADLRRLDKPADAAHHVRPLHVARDVLHLEHGVAFASILVRLAKHRPAARARATDLSALGDVVHESRKCELCVRLRVAALLVDARRELKVGGFSELDLHCLLVEVDRVVVGHL